MIRRLPYALVIANLVQFAGCGVDENPPILVIPPTTEIVNPRLSGEAIRYDLLVSWKGFDEDGTLAGFEIAVDETTAWFFTTSFDSQFAFESRLCCLLDSTALPGGGTEIDSLAYQPHALFVRAVDNDGNRDPSPDRIMFTATNIFPETRITRGPLSYSRGTVFGMSASFAWTGQDRDGSIQSYQYRLDTTPWAAVPSDCTHVAFVNLTTTQYDGDARGLHTFSVQAIDNAGATERSLDERTNVRRWEAVEGIGGTLTIASNVMGARTGPSTTLGEALAGTPLLFRWSADVSQYGGIIQCYEYAYDDTESYSTCDLRWTSFPPNGLEFFPSLAEHNIFVRAYDDAGQRLEAIFPFAIYRGPEETRVLFVDDFDEGSTGSGALFPSDQKENAFWDSLLVGYPLSTFDCEFEGGVPTARIMFNASTVVWYLDATNTRLHSANRPEDFRNPLPAYVAGGGNLIVCGQLISRAFTPDNHFDSTQVAQPGCPHLPQDTYFGPGQNLDWYPAFCDTSLSFVFDALKISRSFLACGNICNLKQLRSLHPSQLPDLPDLELYLGKRGTLPSGTPILSIGLEACDQFLLREIPIADPDIVIPLWAYVDVQGQERRVCGFYVPKSIRSNRGHILVLGFPPYFFKTAEMRDVFRTFLDLFGEECVGPDCGDS